MKLLLSAVLAALLVVTYGYNATWGTIGQYDEIIYTDFIRRSGSFMKVVTQDVIFPTNVSPVKK